MGAYLKGLVEGGASYIGGREADIDDRLAFEVHRELSAGRKFEGRECGQGPPEAMASDKEVITGASPLLVEVKDVLLNFVVLLVRSVGWLLLFEEVFCLEQKQGNNSNRRIIEKIKTQI